jgi:tRNA threonylcarbamoyladenosine biosynthesis protein TsaB
MTALLAFDTAGERMTVALAARGGCWSRSGEGGSKASAALMPAILGVLGEAGLRLADLDAIAFGRGPGAFTGLRTACSVAQGLALGAGKPVLPIDSLLVVAEAARAGAASFRAWAAIDARMAQIYAAEYRFADGRWTTLVAPMLLESPTLSAALARDAARGGRRRRAVGVRAPPRAARRGAALSRGARRRRRAARPAPSGLARRRRRRRGRRAAALRARQGGETTREREARAQPPRRRRRMSAPAAPRRSSRSAQREDAVSANPRPPARQIAGHSLRPMTLASLEGVVALENEVYPFPWTRGNFVDSLAAGYVAWTLNGSGGELLAYCVAMRGAGEMHLLNITVAPAARRQGHARRLLDALVDECRDVGAERLWLEVRPGQRRCAAHLPAARLRQGRRAQGLLPGARRHARGRGGDEQDRRAERRRRRCAGVSVSSRCCARWDSASGRRRRPTAMEEAGTATLARRRTLGSGDLAPRRASGPRAGGRL